MKLGCIYALHDESGAVRYVGMTMHTLERRLAVHLSEARTSQRQYHRLRWIRKMMTAGTVPSIRLIETCSAQEMPERERYWIREYRQLGARLTNSSDGGEGMLNPTPEVRRKLSIAARNKSPEAREKLRAANLGKKASEKARRAMSESHRGKKYGPLSESHRRQISERMKGNKHCLGHRHTEATKAKCAAAKIGNSGRLGVPHTDATRLQLRRSHSGDKSSSAKLTWDQVREIRRRYAAGGATQQALADEYGITLGTICPLINGKTWIENAC